MTIEKNEQPLNEKPLTAVGRFAPSPTGRQHAGNIFAALVAWLETKSQNGRMVLRIEDLDQERSKPEYVEMIQRDLELLGLFWDEGPYFQNDRIDVYEEAFSKLENRGLLYPCFCSRADLHAASAPHLGENTVYARTCEALTLLERQIKEKEKAAATRIRVPDEAITFTDLIQGETKYNLTDEIGDFVIKRSNGGYAYQLAVVLDDAQQEINSIVRGSDLLDSTAKQIFLQKLLGFKQPQYCHIPLMVDTSGRRLSKRHRDTEMDALLQRFKTPQKVLGHIAYLAGIIDDDCEATAEELLRTYSRDSLKNKPDIVWN